MKNNTNFLLSFGLGSALLAPSLLAMASSETQENAVYIPSEENSWELGASALYVQPASSQDFAYATVQFVDNHSQTHSVDRDFDWGYDVFIRYNFEESGRDLTLDYLHFSNGNNDNVQLGELSPDYIYSPLFHYSAEGIIDTSINMVDLTAGQNVQLGEAVTLHLLAGLSYARIKQNEESIYDEGLGKNSIGAPSDPLSAESYHYNNSTFQGIGPKLGADAMYNIDDTDFGLVGGVSFALLLGSQDFSNNVTTATGPASAPNFVYQDNDFDSNSMTVTNINANLGIRYQYEFSDEEDQAIDVELGYQVNEFLDAAYNDNDVSIAGPYLTLAVTL